MSNDLIFYQLSRSKVERGDFSHFLSLRGPDKLPTGRRLREMMNRFVFCIDGYDSAPREIHLIPEIRRFYSAFHEARRLVIEEIKRAKREGVKVLKVIHGHGSSGKGGALYVGLRKSFGLRKKEGVIKDYIAGENFSIFNDMVLALLEAVPELRGDPDLGATNEGVTILWLK